MFEDGHISRTELKNSYRENVQLVEPHVEDLLKHLRGKTVISADHGENLGETRFGITITAHGSQSKEVRFVPWLEVPYQERKTITEESPIGFRYLEEEYVESRLADLGYVRTDRTVSFREFGSFRAQIETASRAGFRQ